MVGQVPAVHTQELHTADGQVYAYVVPVEEMSRLRAEVEELKSKLAGLTREQAITKRERDEYLRKVFALAGHQPLPPMTDAERQEADVGTATLAGVIEHLQRN
jgi:hypothetical protein